ncbi:hypothetical protein AB0L04_10755 [Streptomyces glaucescens]|uniref:hypothetical protein n=1 Tax=Streptomyces glaucescens TaxID=1907 RepID=UPI00344F7008
MVLPPGRAAEAAGGTPGDAPAEVSAGAARRPLARRPFPFRRSASRPRPFRRPARRPHPRPHRRGAGLLLALLCLLPAVPFLAAAHEARRAPFGDRLSVHTRAVGEHAVRTRLHGSAVEARDPRSGALHWRHTRDGRRPLTALHARGETITLWDDGLVTDTDGHRVRWHRALPAATGWLRARGGTGVLRPLGRGMLAVVTPRRVTAYRVADGDLRWVLPARRGCAFAPARAVRHGGALLLAQPCAPSAPWTAQLVAVDDLGRIAPRRRPLGNTLPPGRSGRGHGTRTGHPDAEKVVAPPR